METQITIHGFNRPSMAYCEALGLSKCFEAYANNCPAESIEEGGIGFNPNSGYVYIALVNGIQICSMLGNDVEYLVTDYNNGEEHFFDSYEVAETFEPVED